MTTPSKQSVTFSIKQKTAAGWELIPLEALAGKRLEDALLAMDGRDIVAEFLIEGEKHYFCGTPHWVERMKPKGKGAVTFSEAIQRLRQKGSHVLDEICPGTEVNEVFPGCTVEQMTLL